jgi:predicted transcriptional regulator
MMTLTINLPDELASQMNRFLTEEERDDFAVSAIAEALLSCEQDAVECSAAVEEGLADMEAGRTISLEEEKARWQSEKATLLSSAGVSG